MGYVQLNGHVWGDSKFGYFYDLLSSVLLKFSHQQDQFSLIRFGMKDQPQK